LRGTPVAYWGDIDNHGFAILNRVRSYLPQATSLFMDRATLQAREDRWVQEASPTYVSLSRLTVAESALYEDFVTDPFGSSVRVEQEVIDWEWVKEALRHLS